MEVEGWRGERDYIPIDESHFNVLLIVRDKVTRQCPQSTTFLNGESKRYRSEVLLLTRLTPYR